MSIPIVPWRWGDKYAITEFIQHQNAGVREIASQLKCGSRNQDDLVFMVSRHICDVYHYPLDNQKNPSTGGSLYRYKKNCMHYHFQVSKDYVWALPCEVIIQQYGYCAETANLATSILVAAEVPNCWTVLGEVRSTKDDRLLGYHAWTECPYKEKQYIMETTVDEFGANILIPASSAYDHNSEWAKTKHIYYVSQSRYNQNTYVGEGPLGVMMVNLIGLPAKRVLLFGANRTILEAKKNKRLRKEYSQETRLIRCLLMEAYSGKV